MEKNPGPAPTRAPLPGEAISAQRAVVLEAVQTTFEPVSIAELATQLGLHPNTIREHLEALVDRRYVERTSAEPSGRGRPAALYSAVPNFEPDQRVREYMGLADALAAYIARTSDDPVAAAISAGEVWGQSLAESRSRTDDNPQDIVVDSLSELGFSPLVDVGIAGGPIKIRLRRCPLLDAAIRTPEVVCNAHLGMVRGLIAAQPRAVDAPQPHLEMIAFAEPGACLLTMTSPPHSAAPADAHGQSNAQHDEFATSANDQQRGL